MSRRKLRSSVRKRWLYILIFVMFSGVCAGGLLLYDYVRINLWLMKQRDWAMGYPYVLITKGKEMPITLPSSSEEELLQIIKQRSKRERIVTELACSEVKYNLLKTRAYVQALLETATPMEPPRHSRLVPLFVFKRHRERWALDRIENLYIE